MENGKRVVPPPPPHGNGQRQRTHRALRAVRRGTVARRAIAVGGTPAADRIVIASYALHLGAFPCLDQFRTREMRPVHRSMSGQQVNRAKKHGPSGRAVLLPNDSLPQALYGLERHFAISHGRRVLPVPVEHPPHKPYRTKNQKFCQAIFSKVPKIFSPAVGGRW